MWVSKWWGWVICIYIFGWTVTLNSYSWVVDVTSELKDGGHKFLLFLLNTSMSKNATSEVVHTFRSGRTGGVMNIWASHYIPRLIHGFCRVSFTPLFEVKDCENGSFEKKTAITGLHLFVQYLLLESTANYSAELLKSFYIPMFS